MPQKLQKSEDLFQTFWRYFIFYLGLSSKILFLMQSYRFIVSYIVRSVTVCTPTLTSEIFSFGLHRFWRMFSRLAMLKGTTLITLDCFTACDLYFDFLRFCYVLILVPPSPYFSTLISSRLRSLPSSESSSSWMSQYMLVLISLCCIRRVSSSKDSS